MNSDTVKFLKLMFDETDTVAVSDSKFASHSVPLGSVLSGTTTLVSPNQKVDTKIVPSSELIFVAINPIKGFRSDSNVYSFKNFMLECDTGEISSQIDYLKQLGIPYSAIVFSGSKSAHILISLSKPIEDEESYRTIYQWLLNIGTLFDQACKNPSRSIRIPGAIRPETGLEQKLLEFKGSISKEELFEYLKTRIDAKPKIAEKRKIEGTEVDFHGIKEWAKSRLAQSKNGDYSIGSKSGRNVEWYALAMEFALSNYSEDKTVDILYDYFVPDRDFKEKEWKTCIRSAFKNAYARK